jgi:hypothetical protein
MFKYHPVNRDFTKIESQNRIKKIALSMKEDGLLPHAIVITSKGYVVDGQHRLEAARSAGKGIYYLIDESIPNTGKAIFNAARRYNRDAKVWCKGDYIHGMAEQGSESYKVLQDFSDKYPMFSLTDKMFLLMNTGTRGVGKTEFADGKFEIADINKAHEWVNNLLSLQPYFPKGYNRASFVRTMLTIMEKKKSFKFSEFLHKLNLRPTSLKICGDKKSYSELIESIYNYKRREDEKLNLRF